MSRSEPKPSPPAYPATARGDVVDDYHGTRVADPYRWLEDLDSKEVAGWVAAQNVVTDEYLASIPLRSTLNARLTELWNYSRVGLPITESGQLFYAKNTGLQKQAPIYRRSSPDAVPVLVIDPNVISAEGTTSLAQWAPSPDAALFAYCLAEGGADWQTIKVRDLSTGSDLPDEIRWMRFSNLSWTKDSKGFFYSRYPEPPAKKVLEAALSGQALYYHRVGTPQSEDVLIYERRDLPQWLIGGAVTEDGRYLLITMAKGASNENRLYYADLGAASAPDLGAAVQPIVEIDGAEFAAIGNRGTLLFIRSDQDAPNRRVIALELTNPAPSDWKVIVPEQPEALEGVALIGGRIVGHYLVDVQSRLKLFALDGAAAGEVALPGVGTVSGLAGREDAPSLWFAYSSPLAPATIYRYDPASERSIAFDPPALRVDLSDYETVAGFATSRDGTRVPYFMTARRGLRRDGTNPVMLYGYGGFSVSIAPAYRPDVPAWLELGGAWVTVSLRGGSEYGEAWHKAGMLENKQNVFDDFIAVAEQLVADKVTSPARLGVMGGSNGGLLVGAVVNQRPELFAASLPAVGVMDMLRYQRFTGGRFWVTEYGSAESAEQFPFLIEYSPLHNIRPGACYPATLITTADHDDRVVPSHSFKYAAALQAAQSCDRPVLIRVELAGSHGYRPTDKLIAERADQWAFAAEAMGIRTGGPRAR
ncbi:MAG TPA: prolyl oligopeptidase family serine peptidase [Vicinamibacterales bacterium]|nr:prolyl oligopeptidase family serine peptidase [Vicinamibacterales bacterium]